MDSRKSLLKISSKVEVCCLGGCPNTAYQGIDRKKPWMSAKSSDLLALGAVGTNFSPFDRTERSASVRLRSVGLVLTVQDVAGDEDLDGQGWWGLMFPRPVPVGGWFP